MTVQQLINELSKHPKHLEVWMPYEYDDFSHAPIGFVKKTKIRITETPSESDYKQKKNDTYSKEDCVFISPEI